METESVELIVEGNITKEMLKEWYEAAIENIEDIEFGKIVRANQVVTIAILWQPGDLTSQKNAASKDAN